MPAVYFSVRWPDGKEQQCYSPSTVINDYYRAGDTMSLAEFSERAHTALTKASDRVAERYGYACSSAADQLKEIQRQVSRFEDQSRNVVILSMMQK